MPKPKLHITPVKNWMNDPNGFIYYRGKYHVFYQHFPYDVQWGTMHWGHKTSPDLVNWNEEGIALYPSREFDRNGCFSGSAIEVDEKLHLYYTAIIYSQLNPENIHVSGGGMIASQAMAVSEDGSRFPENTKQVVVPAFDEAEPVGSRENTRDPKVWCENGEYFMVLGSQYQEAVKAKASAGAEECGTCAYGQLLFYSSSDAVNWEYRSRLTAPELGSEMWECPDLFGLDGRYVLLMSPTGLVRDGKNYPNHAVWLPADFDAKGCAAHFTGRVTAQEGWHFLDYGLDFYAPQTTLDEEGRRIMLGWLRMPQPGEEGDWNGMLTFPRVLSWHDGRLYTSLHPNVEAMFRLGAQQFSAKEPMRLSAVLREGSHINIGGYEIWFSGGRLLVDRSAVFTDAAKLFHEESPVGVQFATPPLLDGAQIEIYVDGQVIEIYANQGEYVLTNVVYGLRDTLEYENVASLRLYRAGLRVSRRN